MLASLTRLLYAILPYTSNLTKDVRISSAVMILANLTAIAGTILYRWDAFHIMFLFWCESVIIGLFQIFRILLSGWSKREGEISIFMGLLSIFLAAFFTLHFNGFNAGHLVFLVFFGTINSTMNGQPDASIIEDWVGIKFLTGNLQIQSIENLTIILILLVSHGISFFIHDVKNKESSKVFPADLMFQPYRRIILMHVTIIVGAFAFVITTALLGQNAGVAFLTIFMIMKLVFDLKEHQNRHSDSQKNEIYANPAVKNEVQE
jgi:hypothetical protein